MGRLAWVTSLSSCLAFVMTSLTVASRLSLLWLLRLHKYEQIHPATWYAVVLILLVTPHLAQLIYIIWDTPILSPANRQHFPHVGNIILGVLSSVLEGAATVAFASEVTPVLPEPVLLTLPYAILALSVISDIFSDSNATKQQSDGFMPCSPKMLMRFALGIYLLLTPFVTGVLLYSGPHFRMNLPEFSILVASLVIMSGVWSPTTQKAVMISTTSKQKCQMVELIYAPIRIASTIVSVFMCLYFKMGAFRNDMVGFLSAVPGELTNVYILVPIVLCLATGFLGLMSVVAASKLGLIAAGVKAPFFLCPFLVLATSVGIWHDFRTDAFWELSGDDLVSWTAIVVSELVWIIPFFFPVLQFLKSPDRAGKSMSDYLISFSWNIFFLEPRTILNYKQSSTDENSNVYDHNNNTQSSIDGKLKSNNKTIFLCTTMYKESEKEMSRYMNSIKDVFDNFHDDRLRIEAHVLFDGAVEGGKINVRGRQLLYLLCNKFGLKYSQLIKRTAPYGCQVHTGTLLSHPIFIHFKDILEVKNKKRWSQVMYLNYIMQFRCGQRNSQELKLLFPPLDHVDSGDKACQENEYGQYSFLHRINSPRFNDMRNTKLYDFDRNDCSNSEANLFAIQDEYTRMKRRTSGGKDIDSGVSDTDLSLPGYESKDIPFALSRSHSGIHPGIHPGIHSAHSYGMGDANESLKRKAYFIGSDLETDENSYGVTKKLKNIYYSTSESSSDAEPIIASATSSFQTSPSCTSKSSHIDQRDVTSLDDVFILATDADTAFSARSVSEVLTHCLSDPSLGAICGRTVPVGSAKPIVWYQKFEYAKDFWLVKASQNVIGSVTCCPGCFSLYRGSAIAEVYREFSQPTTSAFDSLVKDHGEDRWLCTLLMQRGWRLAYNAHAQNSTHCPETVGEFLRQRRRWVLSELSNMLSIFITVPKLVQRNPSFSGMFLISLLMTFLWVILSPATTLVFLCAGGHVLFSVPLFATLPFAAVTFLVYSVVCCFMSQSRQKLASLLITVTMATTVLILSVVFVVYVVQTMQKDLYFLGSVQFRPYFLVFLLVLATIYAAILHPRESLSLVYGLSYGLLFPAIFVVLPVYSLSNMVDQSWGTREAGTHRCCQSGEDEDDEEAYDDFCINTSHLTGLSHDRCSSEESQFWQSLKNELIGSDVNVGESGTVLARDLWNLRQTSVILFVAANSVWFVLLSLVYVYAGSDVICYCVASVFSFSLVLQLVGLTCYRLNSLIERYLQSHEVGRIGSEFKTAGNLEG